MIPALVEKVDGHREEVTHVTRGGVGDGFGEEYHDGGDENSLMTAIISLTVAAWTIASLPTYPLHKQSKTDAALQSPLSSLRS